MATRVGPLEVYLSEPLAVLDSLQELRLGTLAVRTSADRRTSVVRLTPFCSPTAVPLLRRSHVVLPRIPPVVAGVSAVRAGLYTVWTRNVPVRSATATAFAVAWAAQVAGSVVLGPTDSRAATGRYPALLPGRGFQFGSRRRGCGARLLVLAAAAQCSTTKR